ncbi:unnamed protein product [Nezara viridula]|uniref:NGFI-A-binding protein 1 n=1 Tax=Nezara viridula TaxID=85310 RepID=A0A9P0E1J4_NEZVI|nr:unnamed protein product [Nezara viridula]
MDYPLPERTPPLTAGQPLQPKILSRNANGTIVWTSSPSNEAELQLYRVMQRASLLAYYDTLLEMGGDDVQQLCEAGEEEFLEIMALVGMASKPLHVRRLQKALQEWLTNPSMFRSPLVPGGGFSPRPVPPLVTSPQPLAVAPQTAPTPPSQPPQSPSPARVATPQLLVEVAQGSPGSQSPGSPQQPPPVLLEVQVSRLAEAAQALVNSLPRLEPKSHTAKRKMSKDLEQVLSMPEDDPKRMELIRKYAAIYGRFDCKRKPEKPLTLHEVSVNEAAAQICRYRPALLTRRDELFPLARQVVRDSGYHYSKGHSKSYAKTPFNGEQPPLKRSRLENYSPDYEEALKRRQERLDQIAEELRSVKEKTDDLLNKEDSGQAEVEALSSRRQQLLTEQTQLVNQSLQPNRLYRQNSSGKILYVDPDRPDTDDTDSQLSFSNESSPLPEMSDSRDSTNREVDEGSPGKAQNNESDDDISEKESSRDAGQNDDDGYENSFYQENKVKVISSSGGHIIAVANPALSMSPAISLENGRTPILNKDGLSPIDPKIS